MPKVLPSAAIRLRGVRQNNLKGFDLDLPVHRLVVITGPSGSGKSSLAFDTLFAEGQRRYVETFSPYARQFFDRMDKPRVDRIEGIPPAIAIEQRNSVRTTRSTVGTMTELCDHVKLVWPHLAELICRGCGRPVRQDTPAALWKELPSGREVVITFDLGLARKLSLEDSLGLVERQGYQRLWIGGAGVRLDEALPLLRGRSHGTLTVVQDRLVIQPANRARFAEACEQAYHFGKGHLAIHGVGEVAGAVLRYSNRLHCAACDLEYREPTPALFSFNHPLGACPACRGFGRVISIDYDRALPDRNKSLAQGVVKPWQSGMSAECQQDLLRFCRATGIPTQVPFGRLSAEHQRWVIEGDPDYGKDEEHEWPRAWYGVKGYFRWLESKAYKMHVRVLLSRYRAYTPCPDCGGRRFRPEALLHQVTLPESASGLVPLTLARPNGRLGLSDFYALTVEQALGVVRALRRSRAVGLGKALVLVLDGIESRLAYLEEVGLGYLTLDRPTRSLSGGETERVNLTTCLGTQLVNTLYVLDEPSVGLHARDTQRLVKILERLRDLGNTVVVVEHEPTVMRAADEILDLGPGHGEAGGELVFQGTVAALGRSKRSLTGAYLAGRKVIPGGRQRPVNDGATGFLRLRGLSRHNLKDFAVRLPLARLVCFTGVSGSGKSTVVRDALYPLLQARLGLPLESRSRAEEESSEEEVGGGGGLGAVQVEGWESLGQVILVDQSSLGRTPRSNPAVYVGAFDSIRDLYAASEPARQRGLSAGAFSFNSASGQCQRCRGAGFEKIEMQFLSDVFVRCPECDGARYRPHVLEVRLAPPADGEHRRRGGGWSIGRMLEATVDEAVGFLGLFPGAPAARAAAALAWLQEVGLGYLRLGQPINTLSGGESQRLKLVSALAEAAAKRSPDRRPTLYLLDEPTTGLHFDDVRVLLEALQKLVEAGHSVVVIEHNLDVIRAADWVIDLGPEAGEGGGRVVAEGPPEAIQRCPASHTGRALRESMVHSSSRAVSSQTARRMRSAASASKSGRAGRGHQRLRESSA